MMTFQSLIRNTAALCAIMTAGVSLAEDGVVRMSDRSSSGARNAPATVRMTGASGIQQASFQSGVCGESCYVPQPCPTQCCPDPCYPMCDPCNTGMCYSDGSAMCHNGSCYTPMDCNSCFNGCDASGGAYGNCQDCRGGRGRGRGRNQGYDDCNNGKPRGFFQKCSSANNKVCDCLFGWMIPSGCCGQGCPPIGKYHMTYANQPSYIDPRDTQLYGAQGYGMPMTVPLAPNVNHAYNYSSGLPASRITQIGNYNPMTSPRRLPCQSW